MAQKRPVAPDTPITAYPTPVISDIVITVDVDSRLPGYKPLEYGTLYGDQTRFPGAKLVAQSPLDDDRFVRRIYATDRVNQDSYNYAIKYSAGSPDHPIYIRTTVEPRASYQPMADGAPDPVISGAYLIDEEAAPSDGELNSLYMKVTRVFETLPGPIVTSYDTNEAGQKITLTTQRKNAYGYVSPSSTALVSVSGKADGTGVIEEQLATLPSIFSRRAYSAERPDMLPQKFRAAVPDLETSELVEGTATQPTLGQGDISASETQQTVFVKQVSRRSRTAPTYPVTIIESTITRQGQFATTTSTLDDGPQTADTGPLVESSEVTDLGDGRTIKVTTSVDQVFDEPSYSKSRDDVTPQKFRASVVETVEEITEAGTATMPATLDPGVISQTEQQVTTEKKRVQVRSREEVVSAELLGGKVFTNDLGGGDADITERYGTDPTITSGYGTISAEKEALGNGKFVTRQIVLPSPPELHGQVYDEQLDLVVPFTQQVVPSTSSGIGEERVEVTPKDVHHSLYRSFDVEMFRAKTLQEYWAVPAYVNVNLPDNLTSVSVVYAKSTSTGGATGTGNSWSVQASGSTSMAGEVRTTIRNGYNGPVPGTRHVFFLDKTDYSISSVISKISNLGGVTVQKWPAIFTEPVNITVAGGSVTERQSQSFSAGSGASNPGSSSSSTDYAAEARVGFVVIQPTLHGSLTVQRPEDVTISAVSSSGSTINVSAPTLTPSYSPTYITPTNPPSFPSGNFIASIDTESYKYGLVRVNVVVAHITSEYV